MDFIIFLEGLLIYDNWEKTQIINQNIIVQSLKKNVWNDKKLIYKEFDKLFNKFQDSILVVSYRSDGIPSESELKELICQYKTNVKIKKYGNYKYALSKNKKSEELLFIGE